MRKLILSAVAAAAVMAAASAHAVPTLTFSLTDTATMANLSCSVTATGLVMGCNTGAGFLFAAGLSNTAGALAMRFEGRIGGYEIAFNSTTSNTPGNFFEAVITNSYDNLRNVSSAGSLIVSMTAVDFVLPAGPALTLSGSQSTSSNSNNTGSITSAFYANGNNTSTPSVGASATTSCVIGAAAASSCPAPEQHFTNVGSFSLQDVMTFNLATLIVGTSSSVQGGSNLQVVNRVPEPMTTALVGLGLFGAALFSRRRKATQA